MVVVDSHQQTGLDKVLGIVTDWDRTGGQLVAEIRISERPRSLEVLCDIKDGIVRGVSLGYSVSKWSDTRAGDGLLTRTATQWTVHELSLVPVPADPGATVRAQEAQNMDDQRNSTPVEETTGVANQRIREVAKQHGLGQAWIDAMIDSSPTSIDQVRAAALTELEKTPTIRSSVGWSPDDPEVCNRAVAEALAANLTGAEPKDQARVFAHVRSFLALARESLEMAGQRTTSFTSVDLIQRSLTTSDFPKILGDVARVILRAAYGPAPERVLTLAREVSVPDFRTATFAQISGPGRLLEKPESAEITFSYLTEEFQIGKPKTFSSGLSVSFEALTNDAVGAFTTRAQRLGQAARRGETLQVVALLANVTGGDGLGPTMSDAAKLFHTNHANIGTAGVISATTLDEARLLLVNQTDGFGNKLGLSADVLLVPSGKRTLADKEIGVIYPTATSGVNPFTGALQTIDEPNFALPLRWYVVSRQADGLVMLRVSGRSGPQVDSQTNFYTKDVEISVLNSFLPVFVDWRGWVTNAGA